MRDKKEVLIPIPHSSQWAFYYYFQYWKSFLGSNNRKKIHFLRVCLYHAHKVLFLGPWALATEDAPSLEVRQGPTSDPGTAPWSPSAALHSSLTGNELGYGHTVLQFLAQMHPQWAIKPCGWEPRYLKYWLMVWVGDQGRQFHSSWHNESL